MSEIHSDDRAVTGHDSLFSCFGLSAPVGRGPYATIGCSLALIKYAIESTSVWFATGQFFSPLEFVNPWLSSKAPFLVDAPGAGLLWLLFTIPFVWIALAMSVRRAADVGLSPWWGLLILIPLINLGLMGLLAILPSGLLHRSPERIADDERRQRDLVAAFRPSSEMGQPPEMVAYPLGGYLATAILLGCLTQVAVGAISVWLLQVYGFILFFSAPVVAGAVTGFIYNRRSRQPIWATLGAVLAMNFVSFAVMLAIGIDGAICLAMAFPLLGPLSFIGGLVGASLATSNLRPGYDEKRGMIGMMIGLPLALVLESVDSTPPIHRVTTWIDIDAPASVVWDQVIAFPEIDDEPAWFFRLGIAAPLRARIDGHGVGAIRHCEFTTGEFIEPITDWNPPRRLAFDVASGPPPMKEWTPFSALHPPHLDRGFVSRRGEFRLLPLPAGGTRLVGSTWYQIDVRPRLYWKAWADPTIHAIHRRVLKHIAEESERQ